MISDVMNTPRSKKQTPINDKYLIQPEFSDMD